MNIEFLKSPQSGKGVAQVYSSGLEFCFISEDLKQCHSFVYCKDFLQDAVQAHLHKKTARIYGFSYNPKKKPPLNMTRTTIAFANKSDKKLKDKIPNAIDFINQFSKKLKLTKTEIKEVSNPPKGYDNVFVSYGSSRWMNSPPLLSMYTLLLRCGFVHTVGKDCMSTIEGIIGGKIKPYSSNDISQLRGAKNGINSILKLGYRAFFYIDTAKNYPKQASTDEMHELTGIVGFSSGLSKDVCSYWHRKSLKERIGEKV